MEGSEKSSEAEGCPVSRIVSCAGCFERQTGAWRDTPALCVESASVLTDRAIRIIADAKIDQAIEAGEFDRLPGFGRPFEFDDTQYDPNWWIRRKLEREALNRLRQGLAQTAAESANGR